MKEYYVTFRATYSGYTTVEAETKEEAEEQVMEELESDAGYFLEAYAHETDLECEAMPVDDAPEE